MLKTTVSFVVGILFVMHYFLGHSAAVVDHQGNDGFSVITGLGGRKMEAHKLQRRGGELTATTTTITTASKNSGATCDSSSIFEARKGDLNVKCKLAKSSSSAKKMLKVPCHDHFVAFGADYHEPVRHPPKHN